MKVNIWRHPAAAVIAAAALLWLSLPGGGGIWPVLMVALVPLLYIAQIESSRSRFFWGLAAGMLHFILQLYWIVIVLERYGGLPWYFSWPAMLLLCLYMGLYVACFTLLGGSIFGRWRSGAWVWLLPVLWVGLDWLRAVLFGGFPWMDPGYGLWQAPLLIQAADLFGHYFLTFALVLTNCLIVFLLLRPDRRALLIHLPVGLVFLGLLVGYGQVRSMDIAKQIAVAPTMVVGVVQGNIDQSRKWSPDEQQRTVAIYHQASRQLLQRSGKPAVVVWPETALPFFPQKSSLVDDLQRLAADHQASLLTGSPWYEADSSGELSYYNAAFVIDEKGRVGARYFKSHLVPFGEYVPLKELLFFLAPLVEAVGDFTPGTIDRPLPAGKGAAGVLICYESIFPSIARKWVVVGADFLVNLTNDAWYGRSSAPHQSMAMSALRSVETRRSLVRAANTGISAFVDPLGRLRNASELFVSWQAVDEIPLLEVRSLHSRGGYLFAPLCTLASIGLALVMLVGRRRQDTGGGH